MVSVPATAGTRSRRSALPPRSTSAARQGEAVVAELRHRQILAARRASNRIERLRHGRAPAGDGAHVVQRDHRPAGPSGNVRYVARRSPTMLGSSGIQPGLAVGGAMHLELGVRIALEALRRSPGPPASMPRQQFRQRRLPLAAQFVHQRPALGRSPPAPRTRRRCDARRSPCRAVDVEGVMGVLERRDRRTPRAVEFRDQLASGGSSCRPRSSRPVRSRTASSTHKAPAKRQSRRRERARPSSCQCRQRVNRAPAAFAGCGLAAVHGPWPSPPRPRANGAASAQLRSTSPEFIASKAPSMPTVPI
jgi:hypothetical protein